MNKLAEKWPRIMLILPDRTVARPKILLPRGLEKSSNLYADAFRWNRGTASQRKTNHGIEDRTFHWVDVLCHDGSRKWRGFFDDQQDFDAFLFALATGSLINELALWKLPTPWWEPDFDGLPFLWFSQTNLTTPLGSQETYTSDATWINSNNTIYAVAGGGGSGGGVNSSQGGGGGGAGGGCSTGVNFSFATPGSTTAGYEIGKAGTAPGAGGNSWFNGTAISSSGAISSIGGGAGAIGTSGGGGTGGAGSTTGAQAQGGGVKSAGGGGGSHGSGEGAQYGGGGGGAGGPNGAGVAGTGGLAGSFPGGAGDAGNDGAAGASNGGTGGAGTEIGGVGFGGGGGGGALTTAGGPGGNYGGGGGGGGGGAAGPGAGAVGGQGAIFLVWVPAGLGFYDSSIFRVRQRQTY